MILFIEPTRVTPYIAYSPNDHILCVRGKSIPDDPITFYSPLFDFLSDFEQLMSSHLKVIFFLEYFNAGSAKVLLNILRKLNTITKTTNNQIEIFWYFEDYDNYMHDIGEDIGRTVDLPFKISGIRGVDEYSTITPA